MSKSKEKGSSITDSEIKKKKNNSKSVFTIGEYQMQISLYPEMTCYSQVYVFKNRIVDSFKHTN